MKILQINKFYPPVVGGVERHVELLAEGLLKAGFDVEVLAANTSFFSRRGTRSGVKVTRVGSLGTLLSMPLPLLFPFYLWRRANADIWHFHAPFPLADFSYWLVSIGGLRQPRPRVFITWHAEIVRQKWLWWLVRPFKEFLLRRAEKIIVATPDHIEYSPTLQKFRGKCVVVPFGIEIEKFKKTEHVALKVEELRSRYGPKIILFIGRLVGYKGLDVLLSAAKIISEKEKNARFIVAGDGPLKKSLRKQAQNLGLGQKVFFVTEPLLDGELPAYYRAASVFVLPSVNRGEAFGIVQAEAMSAGLPVVSTDLPGVRWVNQNRQTGFTVKAGDHKELAEAILEILISDSLREEMSRAARARAEEIFDVKKMINKIILNYEKSASISKK